MMTYRLIGGALLVGVIGLIIWAVQVPSVTDAHSLAETLVIDPAVGETFAPAPPSAHPTLTSEEAFTRYAKRLGAHVTHPLGRTTVYLGLLTMVSGTSYNARDELAYGFATPTGCIYTGVGSPPPLRQGTEWTFLDANTGRVIDSTIPRCT